MRLDAHPHIRPRRFGTLSGGGVVVDCALGGAMHVVMHDVPVQFLPSFSPLMREAVATSRVLPYQGVPVRVVAPEYLAAPALQAGGARRRERACQLLESGQADREELRRLCDRDDVKVEIPDDV